MSKRLNIFDGFNLPVAGHDSAPRWRSADAGMLMAPPTMSAKRPQICYAPCLELLSRGAQYRTTNGRPPPMLAPVGKAQVPVAITMAERFKAAWEKASSKSCARTAMWRPA